MTAARGLTRRVPALAHAEFRRVWFGGTISNSGSMMYIAALGWITTDVTDSAAAIAAVPFIGLVPLFLVMKMRRSVAVGRAGENNNWPQTDGRVDFERRTA